MRRETENSGRGRAEALRRGTRWLRVLKQVIGAPDYSAYLEHCQRAGHEPPLSEREYVREFFERKNRTPRCC